MLGTHEVDQIMLLQAQLRRDAARRRHEAPQPAAAPSARQQPALAKARRALRLRLALA